MLIVALLILHSVDEQTILFTRQLAQRKNGQLEGHICVVGFKISKAPVVEGMGKRLVEPLGPKDRIQKMRKGIGTGISINCVISTYSISLNMFMQF